MSQSKLEITFSFLGTDIVVKGEIMRIDLPLTVQKLIDKSPFTCRTRANLGREKKYWMILVDIKKGPEGKPYNDAKKGDILYCPRQDALFLLFKDVEEFPFPVYYIGRITEGLEKLTELTNGVNAHVEIKDIS